MSFLDQLTGKTPQQNQKTPVQSTGSFIDSLSKPLPSTVAAPKPSLVPSSTKAKVYVPYVGATEVAPTPNKQVQQALALKGKESISMPTAGSTTTNPSLPVKTTSLLDSLTNPFNVKSRDALSLSEANDNLNIPVPFTKNKVASVKNPFQGVIAPGKKGQPAGAAVDFVLSLPDIIQKAPTRAALSLASSGLKAIGSRPLKPTDIPFGENLAGTEVIENPLDLGKPTADILADKAGIKSKFGKNALAIGVGSIFDALDIYPGAGATREKLIKQLVERGTEAEVKTILKGNIKNVTDEYLSRIAPDLARATTKEEVEAAFVKHAKLPKKIEAPTSQDIVKMNDAEIKTYAKTPVAGKKIAELQTKVPHAAIDAVLQKEKEGGLTTKILKDLEGKDVVSKQYILDATNRGELKQVERDLTRDVLATMPDGPINVKEFSDKLTKELLPLTTKSTSLPKNINPDNPTEVLDYKRKSNQPIPKYESITLPSELRGNVKDYNENIYESPIKTSAGNTHFNGSTENYFGHTRIEDMADDTTRRVIEVQSDLYQKGNLDRESAQARKIIEEQSQRVKDGQGIINDEPTQKFIAKEASQRLKDTTKLAQYNDPTAHFRMVREEIQKAAKDGKTKLQFPTGETAMKIEGLGQNNQWYTGEPRDYITDNIKLEPDKLKVGQDIFNGYGNDGDHWIITDVLEDGKFKAVPRGAILSDESEIAHMNRVMPEAILKSVEVGGKEVKYSTHMLEGFDISGKVDTNNPIYKFYEKDVQKYLNKYGGKKVIDDKGVSWIEIPIKPEMKGPVEAFKTTQYYQVGKGPKIDISKVSELLKDIVPPENIKYVFNNALLREKQALGAFRSDAKMEALNPKLKPVIELHTKGKDAYVRAAFHESYHYLEDKVFSKALVRQLDKMTLQIMTPQDIKYYQRMGYKGDNAIASEFRADEFAKKKTKEAGYKSPIEKVIQFVKEVIDRLIKAGKMFVEKVKAIPNKKGGFAKNPFYKDMPKEKIEREMLALQKKVDDHPAKPLALMLAKNRGGNVILGDLKLPYKTTDEANRGLQEYRSIQKKLLEAKYAFHGARVDEVKSRMSKELSPELEERKIALEAKKDYLKSSPLRKLAKYESKSYPGQLPEVNNTGKGVFNKKGDMIIDEALPYQDLGKNLNDVEDVNSRYEKFSSARKDFKTESDKLRKDIADYRQKQAIQRPKPALPQSPQKPLVERKSIPQVETETGEGRSLEVLANQAYKEVDDRFEKEIYSLPQIVGQSFTDVKDKVNALDYLRTPDRVMTKIGLGKESTALRNGYEAYLKELPSNLDKITKWSEEVSKESNKRIFKHLDGEAIDLTAKELGVAREIKDWLREWAKRLNLPADNTISHYITHIFDKELIKKEFDEDLAKIIADKIPGQVYDPFLLKRLGAKGYIQDTWRALEAYVKRASRKVNLDPALEAIKGKVGGTLEYANVEESQWKYVQKYIQGVNMRPTDADKLIDNMVKSLFGYKFGQRPVTAATKFMRQLTYRAMLGLNPGSALRNLSQGVNTFATLGTKYTTIGYSKLFTKAGRDELKRESVTTNNFIQDRVMSATKKKVEKLDKVLFVFFENAEKINRGAAYLGAKAKAIAQGLPEERAIMYAKRVVRKTQFSFDPIDTPVLLQSDLIKTLTQFQTFGLKQVEFLAEMAKDKNFAGLARYVVAGLVFVYTIGQAFGMEPEQIFPSFRFDTPVSAKLPIELTKAGLDTPDQYGNKRDGAKKASDILKTVTGVIPGGTQAKKTFEGYNAIKDGGVYDKGGNLQFKIGTSTWDKMQALMFGKYASSNAKAYFKRAELKAAETKKIKPIYEDLQQLKTVGKTDEANDRYEALSPEDKKAYQDYKKGLKADATKEGKQSIQATYDKLQAMKADGKTDEANAEYAKLTATEKKYYQLVKADDAKKKDASNGDEPDYVDGEVQTEKGIISTVLTYAKAIGTDPITAFDRIFSDQTIRRTDNGTIIVERMSLDDSEKTKRVANKSGSEWKLDHTLSLQLGGDNSPENLAIIPTAIWASYTPIENALGRALRANKIEKKEAQQLIIDFKTGKVTAEAIYQRLKQ